MHELSSSTSFVALDTSGCWRQERRRKRRKNQPNEFKLIIYSVTEQEDLSSEVKCVGKYKIIEEKKQKKI